jgi:hypothetical protein
MQRKGGASAYLQLPCAGRGWAPAVLKLCRDKVALLLTCSSHVQGGDGRQSAMLLTCCSLRSARFVCGLGARLGLAIGEFVANKCSYDLA